ncbi:MAG: hypothetical protein L0K41_05330, partial [Yaniella sp.]|nr:hypothetical protein [Yaniella sp.]
MFGYHVCAGVSLRVDVFVDNLTSGTKDFHRSVAPRCSAPEPLWHAAGGVQHVSGVVEPSRCHRWTHAVRAAPHADRRV